MLIRALLQTSPLWEPIRLVYSWVHRAAHVLSNEEDLRVEQLRRDYRHLLAEMSRRKEQAGDLSGAVSLFLKVTKSYWKGLFRCYSFPEGTLPRTNNDLEHYFGSVRYGERRASGRKGASPAMVLRGSVRAIAAIATPQEGFAAADIRPTNVEGWRSLRASLEKRRESRRAQLRFRPSYASGGTQMPISAGSKSSYSSRLCRPRFFRPHHYLENILEKSPNSSPGPQPHVTRLIRASSKVSKADERDLEDPAGLTIYIGL